LVSREKTGGPWKVEGRFQQQGGLSHTRKGQTRIESRGGGKWGLWGVCSMWRRAKGKKKTTPGEVKTKTGEQGTHKGEMGKKGGVSNTRGSSMG